MKHLPLLQRLLLVEDYELEVDNAAAVVAAVCDDDDDDEYVVVGDDADIHQMAVAYFATMLQLQPQRRWLIRLHELFRLPID